MCFGTVVIAVSPTIPGKRQVLLLMVKTHTHMQWLMQTSIEEGRDMAASVPHRRTGAGKGPISNPQFLYASLDLRCDLDRTTVMYCTTTCDCSGWALSSCPSLQHIEGIL